MPEELTAEEQAFITDSQNEQQDASTETKPLDAEGGEPRDQDPPSDQEAVFKSTREAPDWAKLTDEQRDSVQRVLDGKPLEGQVPHQAMHAERVRRQELERQVADLAAWKAAQEAAAAPKEPEYVDPLVNPDGFRKWSEHQLEKVSRSAEEVRTQTAERVQQEARMQRAVAYEQQFNATVPDYFDAVSHLQTARVSQLRAMGYDDAGVRAQIAKDTNELFDAAEKIGVNPAELAYWRAGAFGYTRKAATTDADKMAALESARKQTQGLGATGAPQSGKPTAAQIAEMSDAELAKLSDEEIAQAFGA